MISVESFARNLLMIGAIAVAAANAAPAHAQLGDADCPGGYYFYPAYRVCVPYGYAYVPDDYPPPIYEPQPYGPTYLFLGEDHDRDRRSEQRRRHDDDQHRR